MRIARATTLSFLAVAVISAAAWAQESQQTSPPTQAGPPITTRMGPRRAGIDARRGRRPRGADRREPRDRQGFMGYRGTGFRRPSGRWRFGHSMGRAELGRRRGFMRFRGMAGLGSPMPGSGMGLARMVNNANLRKQLGITDAQAAKIRRQTSDFQVSQIRSRADVQADELQLRNLLTAPNPDRAAINQKLDQIGAAQLAQRKQQVDFMLAMRDALTPQQRQKLEQMRQAPPRPGGRGQAAPSASGPARPPANP
jgi:Spy/CpxP family protein refolding chaperone